MKTYSIRAYTDYPIERLGDIPHQLAPIRRVKVLSYDRDKYCIIKVEGRYEEIKSGYIYMQPGRAGEVPSIDRAFLKLLPRTSDHYGQTTMNRKQLYKCLFEDVRRYFRYEAEPAKQRSCQIMMRETMRRILDLQERAPDNNDQRSETP